MPLVLTVLFGVIILILAITGGRMLVHKFSKENNSEDIED